MKQTWKDSVIGAITAGAASGCVILAVTMIATSLPSPAAAYEQYSLNRTSGNCATCHGDFRAVPYVSLGDGTQWSAGLHDTHRQTMLSGDCSTCHSGGRFPVFLKLSDGGAGFSPIACLGCHGRAEPGAGGAVKGSGLRQHHDRNGVSVCRDCHTDVNPATFTTAPESVDPPYYFTPDTAHPAKPTDACDGNGSESVVGLIGLDNDGDNAYDANDADCNASAVDGGGGSLVLELQGIVPGSSSGMLRVAITLPTSRPAYLNAYDVTGRLVAGREVGSLGTGRHVIELSGTRLSSGWYILKLSQDGRSITTKTVLLR